MATVTGHIETGLQEFRHYQRINYLMLMMVDKDVHFHVLPRYDTTQSFEGADYPDPGWPAVPDLSSAVTPSEHDMSRLVAALRSIWPDSAGVGTA